MTENRLSWPARIVVGLLTVWGLLVIVPDFARVIDDSYNNKLGFEADNDGILTRKRDPQIADCSAVDLRRNYREGKLNDLLAVFGGMGGMQYVRPDLHSVSLYFVCELPGVEEPHSVLLTVQARPEPLSFAAKITLALAQSLGVFFIAVAAWLVWQWPSPMTWGFFLYGIWFNPGQYFVWYAWLQQWPYALLAQEFAQAVFQALGYCGFILFALRFPRDLNEPRWHAVERSLPAIGAAVLVFQLWSFLVVFGVPGELAARLTFAAGFAIDVAVLFILYTRYREHALEDRHRIRYVFWGCIVGLSAFILAETDVATGLWSERFPEALLYLLYALNASVAIAVYHAVRKYRVVSVKFALSRSATHVLLWILVGFVVVQLHGLVEHRLQEERHRLEHAQALLWPVMLLAFVAASIALKFVVDVLHEHAIDVFDHFFFRKLTHALDHLDGVADALESGDVADPQQIEAKITAEPLHALELASAAVFRIQPDGSFARVQAYGWPPDHVDSLPADLPLIERLTHRRTGAVRLETADLPRAMPGGPAFPSVAVPIFCAGDLHAIAFYGAHSAGDDINRDEIKALEKLGRAASVACQNVELVSLRRRLQELKPRPTTA